MFLTQVTSGMGTGGGEERELEGKGGGEEWDGEMADKI